MEIRLKYARNELLFIFLSPIISSPCQSTAVCQKNACKLRFNPSSANSFSNLERSELTQFRDRAGQRWKANAGPCFPAKGAITERRNSALGAGFCQWLNFNFQ